MVLSPAKRPVVEPVVVAAPVVVADPDPELPPVEIVPFPPSEPPEPVAPPKAPPGVTAFPEIHDFYIGPTPGKPLVIRGRVADAQPQIRGEGVDREALARYIRSRKAAIQGCYEKELRRNLSLKGKLVVGFKITRMGRASEIGVEADTTGNEAVGSCVRAIIRGWVFPFKPENDTAVTYPFVFSPAPT